LREITVKISDKVYAQLKQATSFKNIDKTVDKALKQFLSKNHSMNMRRLLKRGYRTFGRTNLRLARVLEEDKSF